MIYLFLNNGGLGNQLFQYAFARALQVQYGGMIRCDISKFSYKGTNATRRPIAINEFNLLDKLSFGNYTFAHGVYKIENEILNMHYKKSSEAERYYAKSKLGIYAPDKYMNYYVASNTKFTNKYINGLFQAHAYFDDIIDILRCDIALKNGLSGIYSEYKKQIINENSVCVHWRRGDYLEAKYKHLNVCDEFYYDEALRYITEGVKNPVFYVFTNTKDDARWIEKHINVNENIHYVNLDLPDLHSDTIDFELMKCCKHFIISNSTFSWWGQYLSESKEKIVIAPKKWINRDVDTADLYMDTWILI